MNIFNAVGTTLESVVSVITKTANATEKLVDSVDDFATVCNKHTNALVIETELELNSKLDELRAKLEEQKASA